MPVHLDVAKWSKAKACKAEGASPRPFESDRRVQASLAQWTRAAGFYPAGRPFESATRYQRPSPIAQMAERLAVNQEVRGSKPRRGASVHLGVAQLAARMLREHQVAGSRPATETSKTCVRLGVAVAQWQSSGM